MAKSIPILDISEFKDNQETFVEALGEAYSGWGFAGIVNHNIGKETISNAFDAAKNPKRYPAITAHEYLMERLREIGLVK